MSHHPYRPAHWKAFVLGATNYACFEHEMQLRAQMAPVEAVPPHERDSASHWCSFCRVEGDISHTKESER